MFRLDVRSEVLRPMTTDATTNVIEALLLGGPEQLLVSLSTPLTATIMSSWGEVLGLLTGSAAGRAGDLFGPFSCVLRPPLLYRLTALGFQRRGTDESLWVPLSIVLGCDAMGRLQMSSKSNRSMRAVLFQTSNIVDPFYFPLPPLVLRPPFVGRMSLRLMAEMRCQTTAVRTDERTDRTGNQDNLL